MTKENIILNGVEYTIKKTKQKQLVCGIGINDANYTVKPIINGKTICCPYYSRWKEMLVRAYSDKLHQRQPTYKDTIVCNEWLSFMNFREWMIKQKWEGLELDKDIIKPNNKVYSPNHCCFVTKQLNTLLIDCGSSRGDCELGVTFDKERNKFMSSISIHGKRKFLGRYSSEIDAHQAYLIAKIDYIKTFYPFVSKQIKKGLKKHIKLLEKGLK